MLRNRGDVIRRGEGRTGQFGLEQVKELLVVSALTIALAGCGLSAGLAVQAFDDCIARHPQETALCEGPRQAYKVDTSVFQARAPPISPAADSSYEDPSASGHPVLKPVAIHPN